MGANTQPGRRARSLAEMVEIMGRLGRPEEFAAGIGSYRPRPTDIIISPFGKCGTTWLQQMFHTLRTGGDMDFDDISRVVPWIEPAALLGIDLEAPQKAEPRGFKSHLSHDRVPKGARYIVSVREPKDALVSMYRFLEGWVLEPGAVSIAEFAPFWIAADRPGNDIWSHQLSWWEQRGNPDVLLLSYEHMVADPAAAIRKVAAFCGVALDEGLLARTLEHVSLGFMLAHKDRYDDLLMRELFEARAGLPPGSDSAKVRKGGTGGHRTELPADIAAAVDARWAELMTPRTGLADYPALEAAVRRL